MAHLLLVDDEESLRSVVAERLTDEGHQVTQASDGEAALKALDGFAFDVIVSDLRLPGVGGREVIDAAISRYPGIIAIVVTGYGTVKDAVDMTICIFVVFKGKERLYCQTTLYAKPAGRLISGGASRASWTSSCGS